MAIDQARIQKTLSKLEKFFRKIPKQPSPAEVHNLRTNARKLETMFQALGLDSASNERRLLKSVRRVRRRAGRVRDLDVLTGHLARTHADREQECEVQLLEYLGSKRRKQAGKLHNIISSQRSDLKVRLRKASSKVDKCLNKKAAESASQAAAQALRLSSELPIPRRLNRGNLHPYRLKVKELRYVLQLAPSSDSEFVDDLGHVKDAIGEWHDWEELVAIANDVLDHGPGCGLLKKLKQTSESKFQEAIHLAESLRKNYVRPSSRKKPAQPAKLAPAAIEATVALSETARQAA